MNSQLFKLYKISILYRHSYILILAGYLKQKTHESNHELIFHAKRKILKQEDRFLEPTLPLLIVGPRQRLLAPFLYL